MKLLQALVGGFAGAIALNLLHETARRVDSKAPRIDLLGEQALNKTLSAVKAPKLSGNKLYAATLAGDIVSNVLYYSLIGLGEQNNTWTKALTLGLTAGIGAIEVPKNIGLNDEPVTKTNKTKILTVAWYLFGAIVTASIINTMRKNDTA